jgi:hypothetical protein
VSKTVNPLPVLFNPPSSPFFPEVSCVIPQTLEENPVSNFSGGIQNQPLVSYAIPTYTNEINTLFLFDKYFNFIEFTAHLNDMVEVEEERMSYMFMLFIRSTSPSVLFATEAYEKLKFEPVLSISKEKDDKEIHSDSQTPEVELTCEEKQNKGKKKNSNEKDNHCKPSPPERSHGNVYFWEAMEDIKEKDQVEEDKNNNDTRKSSPFYNYGSLPPLVDLIPSPFNICCSPDDSKDSSTDTPKSGLSSEFRLSPSSSKTCFSPACDIRFFNQKNSYVSKSCNSLSTILLAKNKILSKRSISSDRDAIGEGSGTWSFKFKPDKKKKFVIGLVLTSLV